MYNADQRQSPRRYENHTRKETHIKHYMFPNGYNSCLQVSMGLI